jgi:flagellar biosynthesis/type III secretory pathway chaperone
MKEIQVYQTLINQWTLQYQELFQLVTEEKTALENRDFETLEKLVQKKNVLVAQINLDQIPAIIDRGKVAQPKLAQVKQYCSNSPELKSSWNELMSLVGQCFHLNEVNAQLIELLTKSTKRTFNIIKGFDPDNNIYDAKGDRKIVSHYGQPVSA